METAIREDYSIQHIEGSEAVRDLVMEGLKQVELGKTKDFDAVCERLEKKYSSAAV